MAVHLTTAVGGYVKVLPHMLRHYRALGVDSFFVHVNLLDEDDPILDEVRAVCEVTSVSVGGRLWRGNADVHRAVMARHPDDWFLVADQDELQEYPGALHEILESCERRGYDFIEGTLVDRLAPGGVFAEVDPRGDIWEQFPLTALVTAALLGGEPRKVVAAKGRVALHGGQHRAEGGRGCPVDECHVAVHHFKWTAGIVERLRARVALLRARGLPFAEESERFLRYVAEHGEAIDVRDPRFFAGAVDMATLRDVSDALRLAVLTG
jgi:hypothetical protein